MLFLGIAPDVIYGFVSWTLCYKYRLVIGSSGVDHTQAYNLYRPYTLNAKWKLQAAILETVLDVVDLMTVLL